MKDLDLAIMALKRLSSQIVATSNFGYPTAGSFATGCTKMSLDGTLLKLQKVVLHRFNVCFMVVCSTPFSGPGRGLR